MNFFLHINKNLIFFFGLIVFFSFLIIILTKQFNINKIQLEISDEILSDVDIEEPKFAMNNNTKKIYITANEGNFLNEDEILLKDNVKFKSNDFSIETEKVIFNRDKQTAKSETRSLFKSSNTMISSDGFNIHDDGNKIIFYGNSIIVLK